MKGFITKENIWYRTQQLIIFVLHLILLKWMYFTLANSGRLSMTEVLYHFVGMSVMGALLIRGSAYWARHHYIKEIKNQENNQTKENQPGDLN